MIDAWDEDHICSSYIQPSFFAHECSPHDSNVINHVPHVRQTIASTPLLHYIQEAHKPQNNSLQVSSSKLRGTVRIAQENNLQYINMSRTTTNLTGSQTAIHAHPTKMILNLTHIRTMLAVATVIIITTVNMTKIRFTVIAKTQATNDN